MVRLLVHGAPEEVQLVGANLAVWVVQNAYSWCAGVQTALAQAGAIPVLIRLMGMEAIDAAAAALRNVISCRPEYKVAAVAEGVVPVLAWRLHHGDPDLLPTVVGAICNLAAGGPFCQTAILAAGTLPKVVRLLDSGNVAVRAAAAGVLANVAAAKVEESLRALASAGAVPALTNCLQRLDDAARPAARALAF